MNLETLSDLCTPWCIRVVVTLRIAERVNEGETDITALSRAAGCDPAALESVMIHLVSKGVFERDESGRFLLNEGARGLLDPWFRIGLDLNGIGGRMSWAWGSLLKYVQTGKPAYSEIFGMPFWEDLDANPEIGKSFDDMMGPIGHGTPDPSFDIDGGWENIHHIVDVGGGTGAMLAGILNEYPWIRSTLVELPRTAALSSETFEGAGVEDRVEIARQSFFDPLPPGADLYIIRKVINDWPDEEAIAILKRCGEAAGRNGRVVVLKSFVEDKQVRGLAIEMMLVGGKSRTLSDARELLKKAGLRITSTDLQSNGDLVVEARSI
jgi:hypothetical protein